MIEDENISMDFTFNQWNVIYYMLLAITRPWPSLQNLRYVYDESEDVRVAVSNILESIASNIVEPKGGVR